MKHYDYILFDLDGTLIESAKGVELSIAHTMEALCLPCPDLSDYTLYIGPPLVDTFRGMCAVPEPLVKDAMQIYRDYYDIVGMANTHVYDGIFPMLSALRESGCKLAVCTSKNEPVAEKVVEKQGLLPYFDAVCGSAVDGRRKAKADLIPYAAEILDCTDKSRAVMIGDTFFDAKGAYLCGVDFFGVTYGYGTKEAMEAYGAKAFADTPDALRRLILN